MDPDNGKFNYGNGGHSVSQQTFRLDPAVRFSSLIPHEMPLGLVADLIISCPIAMGALRMRNEREEAGEPSFTSSFAPDCFSVIW